MKVVHIQLRGPYTDNWGYQENILPRCQVRIGDDVSIITQNKMHLSSGEIVETEQGRYKLQDGVEVIRISPLKVFMSRRLGNVLGNYNYYQILEKIKPDLIFVHGLFTGVLSTKQLIRYKNNNPSCTIVLDSHEYGYGMNSEISLKKIFVRGLKRKLLKSLLGKVAAVYCITPECIRFATDYYKIPKELIQQMPLGFDDEMCDLSKKKKVREKLREKHHISNEEIVIIHGGKIIPRRKTNIAIKVIEEVKKKHKNVKLIIFGDMSIEVKEDIQALINGNSDCVAYLGHLSQKEYIDWFLASDIGLFPGAPSALLQEAIGCELLLVLCRGNDFEYLNRGNNVLLCNNDDIDDIAAKINFAIESYQYSTDMNLGLESARLYFSYNRMANELREVCVN